MTKVNEFFEKVTKAAEANPGVATASDAIFQFNISGDEAGVYVLDLTSGKTSDFLSREPHANAGAKISVSSEDWLSMLDGSLDPMAAFMGGKITIDGDLNLAMNLPKLMKLAQ
jgi:putative sterol carrier protein